MVWYCQNKHARQKVKLTHHGIGAAWATIDSWIAYVFGFDESKYQWAVDDCRTMVGGAKLKDCASSDHCLRRAYLVVLHRNLSISRLGGNSRA